MKNKFESTEYMMDAIKEVEKEIKDLNEKMNSVYSERDWNRAAAQWKFINGMINGICWVVNAMEECTTCEVLQDVLEKWEELLEAKKNILMVMKKTYVEEVQEA